VVGSNGGECPNRYMETDCCPGITQLE
jgi:hypothetical protein